MIDLSKIDHSSLDRPEVLMFLFHPRPEWGSPDSDTTNLMIPVEDGVSLGARFHMADQSSTNLLFFHGNGEIVADYDDLAPYFNRLGINFLPVDYRGYGRSGGTPTITAMMRDCHKVFNFTRKWFKENGFWGPVVVMGRSLGSAPALEIAANYGDQIRGLIIESGFARTEPLLRLLGIDTVALGIKEGKTFQNIDKIRHFSTGPTLVIHGEKDHIIPFADGQALYDACGSPDKTLLRIDGANHNNLFELGLDSYLKAMGNLNDKIGLPD
ncbi:MAG: alpha/beta hydrolase [Desulfobacterales bacterium]|nr:alpha/beta hydrolase [Desulfobacterales bacterium]